MQITPKEQALQLLQKIGSSTMFTEANDGMSLPLNISKKIAILCIAEFSDNLITEEQSCNLNHHVYWVDVIKEIKNFK